MSSNAKCFADTCAETQEQTGKEWVYIADMKEQDVRKSIPHFSPNFFRYADRWQQVAFVAVVDGGVQSKRDERRRFMFRATENGRKQ